VVVGAVPHHWNVFFKLNISLEAFNMRKFLDNVKTLSKDKDGVVSFEYVIVAAAIVGAVTLAFGAAGGAGPISTALAGALAAITAKL
jgi:pilus assembly protein Flp/PilA